MVRVGTGRLKGDNVVVRGCAGLYHNECCVCLS